MSLITADLMAEHASTFWKTRGGQPKSLLVAAHLETLRDSTRPAHYAAQVFAESPDNVNAIAAAQRLFMHVYWHLVSNLARKGSVTAATTAVSKLLSLNDSCHLLAEALVHLVRATDEGGGGGRKGIHFTIMQNYWFQMAWVCT